MSLPKSLRSFAEAAGLVKPSLKHTYAIHYASLQRFFQFSDSSIFDIEDNIPTTDEGIQAFASILDELGNPSALHLRNPATKIGTRSHYLRDSDSSFFTFVEYTTPKDGKTPAITWCTMALVKTQTSTTEILFDPHFCMTGQYTLMPQGSQAVIPMKTLCRFNLDGEDVFFGPENYGEMCNALTYGNQALMQLLSGTDIDSAVNQAWLFDKEPSEISDEVSRLLVRGGQNFHQEIRDFTARSPKGFQ